MVSFALQAFSDEPHVNSSRNPANVKEERRAVDDSGFFRHRNYFFHVEQRIPRENPFHHFTAGYCMNNLHKGDKQATQLPDLVFWK